MTSGAALVQLRLALAFGPASALDPDSRATLLDPDQDAERLLDLAGQPGGCDALAALGVPPAQRARLRSAATTKQADWILEEAQRQGMQVLFRGGPSWPRCLARLPAAPRVLFARGRVEVLEETVLLAIVGARHATPYGREATRAFVEALALADFGTCSGLARGIDAEVHTATLAYGQPTVAVLGSGLARIYPKEHEVLAARIVDEGGLLLSEMPPGVRALRTSFPRRNRILAGLARGVLVVEAARRSGALITASWAGVYGRPVWAVPGPYNAAASEGCNALIRDGNALADGPSGLLEDLSLELGIELGDAGRRETPVQLPTRNASRILELLARGPRPTDVLASELEMPFAELLLELQALERSGWVEDPGGLWRRAR